MAMSQEPFADTSLAVPAEAERFYWNVPYQSRGEYIAKNLKHIIFLTILSIGLLVGIFTAHTLLLMTALITVIVSFFVYMLLFDKLPGDAINGLRFILSSRCNNREDMVKEAYATDLRRTNDVIRWTREILQESMYHLRFSQPSEFYSVIGVKHYTAPNTPYTSYHVSFVPDMHATALGLAQMIQREAPDLNMQTRISEFQRTATQWNSSRAVYMLNQSMTLGETFVDLQRKMSMPSSKNNPDIPAQLANLVGLLASTYGELRGINEMELPSVLVRPVFEALASSQK